MRRRGLWSPLALILTVGRVARLVVLAAAVTVWCWASAAAPASVDSASGRDRMLSPVAKPNREMSRALAAQRVDRRRDRKRRLPGPRTMSIERVSPDQTYGAYAFADVENDRILTTGPLSRHGRGHEAFHLLDDELESLPDGRAEAIREDLRQLLHAPAGDWWGRVEAPMEAGPQMPNHSTTAGEWAAEYFAAAAAGWEPPKVRRTGRVLVGGNEEAFGIPIGPKRLRRFGRYMDELRRKLDLPVYVDPRDRQEAIGRVFQRRSRRG